MAVGCFGVLALAAWLTPSDDGHGTHTQIGLNKCAWVVVFDKPCMTCGMTTSFAHAADADFVASATAQPMGTALSIATSIAFWAALSVAVTGSTIGRSLGRCFRPKLLILVLLLGVLAWVYKIATWQ